VLKRPWLQPSNCRDENPRRKYCIFGVGSAKLLVLHTRRAKKHKLGETEWLARRAISRRAYAWLEPGEWYLKILRPSRIVSSPLHSKWNWTLVWWTTGVTGVWYVNLVEAVRKPPLPQGPCYYGREYLGIPASSVRTWRELLLTCCVLVVYLISRFLYY
jgi:hypothetical protein